MNLITNRFVAALLAVAFCSAAPAALAQEEGGLEFTAWKPSVSRGDFSANLVAIVQHDAADYDQDVLAPGAPALEDGERFRRARIGLEAAYGDNLSYTLLYEFGGSHSLSDGRLLESAVEYTGLKVRGHSSIITAGVFAPNMGLENAASSSTPMFAERPSSIAIARGLTGDDGRYGVQAIVYDDRWLVSGAVTGGMRGDRDSFGAQTGYIARFAYLPWQTEDAKALLGVNVSQVARPARATPGLAPTPLRLRDRPESRVDGQRLIDTGSIDADGITILGLEGAYQRGSLLVQAEYAHYDLERRLPVVGQDDPSFAGWYVQASYVLNGARRYRPAKAAFDGPSISQQFNPAEGQWGKFELVGRISVIDLNDNEGAAGAVTPAGGVRGGEQTIHAVGVNWYTNPILRFSLSYQQVDIERLNAAGAPIGQQFDAVMLRSQLAF